MYKLKLMRNVFSFVALFITTSAGATFQAAPVADIIFISGRTACIVIKNSQATVYKKGQFKARVLAGPISVQQESLESGDRRIFGSGFEFHPLPKDAGRGDAELVFETELEGTCLLDFLEPAKTCPFRL